MKENQIALRAAYLEEENNRLKDDLQDSNILNTKLKIRIYILKQKLMKNDDL